MCFFIKQPLKIKIRVTAQPSSVVNLFFPVWFDLVTSGICNLIGGQPMKYTLGKTILHSTPPTCGLCFMVLWKSAWFGPCGDLKRSRPVSLCSQLWHMLEGQSLPQKVGSASAAEKWGISCCTHQQMEGEARSVQKIRKHYQYVVKSYNHSGFCCVHLNQIRFGDFMLPFILVQFITGEL